MITLFSSTLEISVAAFIWDQVFVFGEYHMMRVAIAVSKIVEKKTLLSGKFNIEDLEL